MQINLSKAKTVLERSSFWLLQTGLLGVIKRWKLMKMNNIANGILGLKNQLWKILRRVPSSRDAGGLRCLSQPWGCPWSLDDASLYCHTWSTWSLCSSYRIQTWFKIKLIFFVSIFVIFITLSYSSDSKRQPVLISRACLAPSIHVSLQFTCHTSFSTDHVCKPASMFYFLLLVS